MTSVAAVVVSYNGWSELSRCLDSLVMTNNRGMQFLILVVDNCSSDGTPVRLADEYPDAELLKMSSNLGYGCAANAAWEHLHGSGRNPDYLCILNQDLVVDVDWLAPLVSAMEDFPETAIVQPQILLLCQRDQANVLGLRCHYLGFSYVSGFGQTQMDRSAQPKVIDAASGAAMMVRCECLCKIEKIFASDLFMYQEDVELSWIVRTHGYDCRLVPGSIVYHKYESAAFRRNYYLLERNRWRLVLTRFSVRHLLLTFPAHLLMEVPQLVWAAANGLLKERFRVYKSVFSRSGLRQIVDRRLNAARRGEILSSKVIHGFSGTIESPELTGPLHQILNGLLAAYWRVLKWFSFSK